MSLTHDPQSPTEGVGTEMTTAIENRRRRLPWVVCALVCLVVVLAAAVVALIVTGTRPTTSAPIAAPAPSSVSSTPYGSGYAPTRPSTQAGDARACGALEQYGTAFYTSTYRPLMLQNSNGGRVSMDVDPIQLSAQLAVLDSQLDPSTLAGASEPVRSALTDAGDDAGSLAQAYANVRVYGGRAPELTPVLTSYTEALTTCTMAGHQPSYFDFNEIAGR